MKKSITTTMALTILLSVIQPNFIQAEERTKGTYQEEGGEQIQETLNLPSVRLLEKYIQDSSSIKETQSIDDVHTKEDFFKLMDKIYTELPSKVMLKTAITKEEINKWHSEYEEIRTPSEINNLHTLASYTVKKKFGKVITITDESNPKYTAKQIEKGTKRFAKEFANKLNGLNNEQKIKVIYEFVYAQYKYDASSYSNMLIGNAYNKKLACNGFSRLFYELAIASNIDAKLIESDDHFYNHVKMANDEWIIMDLTTDILLKRKYGAIGLSQDDYLNYVSNVGFYWAKPVEREKAIATAITTQQKDKFMSAIIPKITY